MEELLPGEKQCNVCHQIKPLSEFVKDKAYKDGYRNECKQCKGKRLNRYLESWKTSNTEPPVEKKCKQCNKIKPISEFCKNKYYKDGFHHICKSCQSQRQKDMKARWEKQRTTLPHEKVCSKCHRMLPSSQFTKSINCKDGLNNLCKNCQKQRKNNYKKRWKKQRLQNPDSIREKQCPSCHKTLPISKFYKSESHKDGLSFYCISCELRNQKRFSKKWEKQRSEKQNRVLKKECNICHRILPISQFYKNRRYKSGVSATCISCETKRQINYMANWRDLRIQQQETITEKECIICHRVLPASSFNKNKRRKNGLTSACKNCEKKRQDSYIKKWDKQRKQEKTDDSFSLFPTFEKKCTSCKRTLPLSQFYPKIRSKDGLSSSCIDCDRKTAKESRSRFIESGRWKENLKNIPSEKECRRCNMVLPSSSFNSRKESRDGLSLYCKQCISIQNKAYRDNPETHERLLQYWREYNKKPEVRKRNRKWARKYARRPDVKEKRKQYLKEYIRRPEVIEHRKKYLKEYHKKKKQKAVKS